MDRLRKNLKKYPPLRLCSQSPRELPNILHVTQFNSDIQGDMAEILDQLLGRPVALGDLARQISHAHGDNGHRAEMTAELLKELANAR